MVLHILSDDKFTDYAIKQFQAEEMQSEMVVIPSGAGHLFTICDKVRVISYPSSQFIELLSNLGNYSGIILHGIFWKYCEDIIIATPQNVKIAWYFWGGELYSRPDVLGQFLAPLTKFLYKLHVLRKRKFSSVVWRLPLNLFQRIDYCLSDEEEEFFFAKQYIGSKIKYLWYSCYSLEETVGSLIDKYSSGSNIMLCNSAALESNVFDAILRLHKPSYRKKIKDQNVIMPLSYGSLWIKNLMLRIGSKCFRHFIPIVDFIPREEYNRILLNCSTIILPYYSPAAQGNIITALWLGMRVYLSGKSISYNYFKRLGVYIYSFETDFVEFGFSMLSNDEVEHNREILRKEYGKINVIAKAKQLIHELNK